MIRQSNLRIAAFAVLAMSSTAQALASGQRVQDVFVGNSQVYHLSWKGITDFSETITVDSVRQMRNIDYTIDPVNGTFSFVRPISSRSAVLAVYDYDSGHAVHTGTGVSIPISLALAEGETRNVTFNALYHASDNSQTATGSLSLGLGGQWQTGSNTQISSRFMYTPDTNSAEGHKASDGIDRAGISLGLNTSTGKLKRVSFGFTQAGSMLDSAAAGNGLSVGTRTLTLGTGFDIGQHMAATFDYGQTDHMKSEDGSSGRTAIGLTFDPSAKLHLQTHMVETLDSHQARVTTTDLSMAASPTDKLKLQTNIVAVASANNTHADNAQITISDDPSSRLHLQTNLASNNATGQANTSNAAVGLTAHPTDKVSVDASYNTQQSDAAGEHHVMNLSAAIAASQKMTLTADTQQTGQGGQGTSATGIGVKLSPSSAVNIDAHMQFRSTNESQTQAAFVQGDFKAANFMTFAASYTARSTTAQSPDSMDGVDSSSAKIVLTPRRDLQVYGTYDQNPEQNGRVVSRSSAHGLGGNMHLGLLTVGGGYLWTDGYQSSGPGKAIHVDVGVQFAPKTKLTAGYQQSLSGLSLGPNGQDVYSVGLQHDLGDRFQLSVSGTVNRPVAQSTTTSPTYNATANLGMKF